MECWEVAVAARKRDRVVSHALNQISSGRVHVDIGIRPSWGPGERRKMIKARSKQKNNAYFRRRKSIPQVLAGARYQ